MNLQASLNGFFTSKIITQSILSYMLWKASMLDQLPSVLDTSLQPFYLLKSCKCRLAHHLAGGHNLGLPDHPIECFAQCLQHWLLGALSKPASFSCCNNTMILFSMLISLLDVGTNISTCTLLTLQSIGLRWCQCINRLAGGCWKSKLASP